MTRTDILTALAILAVPLRPTDCRTGVPGDARVGCVAETRSPEIAGSLPAKLRGRAKPLPKCRNANGLI